MPQIEELGYNPEMAKSYALQALKYECFKAEGVELEKEENENDAAEKLDWEYAVIIKYNGKRYAFAPDFDEWREGARITSDEIKKVGKFPD